MIGVDLHERTKLIATGRELDRRQVGQADPREEQASLEAADGLHTAVDDHGAAVLQVKLDAQPLGVIGQKATEGGSAGVEIHGRASAESVKVFLARRASGHRGVQFATAASYSIVPPAVIVPSA